MAVKKHNTAIKNTPKHLLGIQNLSKDVTENVVLWDERLSRQGAFNLSNDLALNTTKRVSKLDQNSAQFILQGVLDYLTK